MMFRLPLLLLATALCAGQDGAPAARRLLAFAAQPGDGGLGSVLVTPGDLDGDGIPDLLLGAPQLLAHPQPGAGRLRAVSGADGRLLFEVAGLADGEAFGSAAARVGDWDGDGTEDLVIGAPRDDTIAINGGALRLHSGRTGMLMFEPTRRAQPGHPPPEPDPVLLAGEEPFGALGSCLVSLPDLDGDGLADLAAGAPSDPLLSFDPGYVLVVSSAHLEPLLTIWGDDMAEGFGGSLAVVPDLDGDGTPELAIGAPTAVVDGATAGRVLIVSPRTGNTLHELSGEPGERFGAALAALPDLDGDGSPELLVGAPDASLRGPRSGAVHVVSIVSGERLRSFDGDAAHDGLGRSVAASDVDGDGVADVITGAPGADGGGFGAGRIAVYSALSGETLMTIEGAASGLHLGTCVASPGDLDGDGLADVAAGMTAAVDHAAAQGGVLVYAGTRPPAPDPDENGRR